jgi:hypothetical protein
MKLHLPGRRQAPAAHVDPGRPHAFVAINDPGIGAMAAGSAGRRETAAFAAVAVADNLMRKSRCGVPGCGRDRSDDMHAVPQD